MTTMGRRLTPPEQELVVRLMSECAEVIHAAEKLLSHGADPRHPDGGDTNHHHLSVELGHVEAVATKLAVTGVVDQSIVHIGREAKLAGIGRYLHGGLQG